MPEIRDGEEGVEEGRKGKGEVEEGRGKEGDEDGKGEGGEIEEREDGGVKEGVEEEKEGREKKMTEVHHGCSGVNTSGETTRRMKASHL